MTLRYRPRQTTRYRTTEFYYEEHDEWYSWQELYDIYQDINPKPDLTDKGFEARLKKYKAGETKYESLHELIMFQTVPHSERRYSSERKKAELYYEQRKEFARILNCFKPSHRHESRT